MRLGCTKDEVLSLAKTMEIKFSVAGPQIGGAKSGINFDPKDPRKDLVLKKWYQRVVPLLKTYYGTGGDMNVDEVKDVIPITEKFGLLHPQEGIVMGHFNPDDATKKIQITQLQKGVALTVHHPEYNPIPSMEWLVADLITGYGVSESVKHFYKIYKDSNIQGKRVIVQGFGNVAGAAAFYLAQQGALIVGIIDKDGGIIDENGYVQDFITHGMDEAAVARMASPPQGDGVLGLLIKHPEPIRLANLADHPASIGFPENHPPMGSFLGVPVRVRGAVFGNLYLTEKANAAEFSDEDEEMIMALAAIAGLSIENVRLSEKNMSLAVYQDRDRIARDMHDLVIQRIFATGLTLQSIIPKLIDLPVESEKLANSIHELNNTIQELRQTILHLTSVGSDEVTLRRRVISEVEAYRKFLKSTPSITFEGSVDISTSNVVSDQLVATLRELLSNAVKHADATELSVSVQLLNQNLVLTVVDD
jgi:signal transduction histidine kinase